MIPTYVDSSSSHQIRRHGGVTRGQLVGGRALRGAIARPAQASIVLSDTSAVTPMRGNENAGPPGVQNSLGSRAITSCAYLTVGAEMRAYRRARPSHAASTRGRRRTIIIDRRRGAEHRSGGRISIFVTPTGEVHVLCFVNLHRGTPASAPLTNSPHNRYTPVDLSDIEYATIGGRGMPGERLHQGDFLRGNGELAN